uniref:Locomotion-related protein Hikaru genki n=1 Tax=Culex pipiens TaxID=7175 RepID=A0A8D8AGU0_CULPI
MATVTGKICKIEIGKCLLFVTLLTSVCFRAIRSDEAAASAPDANHPQPSAEPETSTGCPPPDLKVSRPRKHYPTTEAPFVTFETTQIYVPQDFTTADFEFVDGKKSAVAGISLDNQEAQLTHDDTPFWWEMGIQNAEARESLAAASFPGSSYKNRAKRALRRRPARRFRRSSLSDGSYGQDNALHQEQTPVIVINNVFNENDSDHSVYDNVFLNGNQLDGADGQDNEDREDRYVDKNEIGEVLEAEIEDDGHGGVAGIMARVKRKSGKTTGALSRAKGSGSDSGGSKSITRHNKQDHPDDPEQEDRGKGGRTSEDATLQLQGLPDQGDSMVRGKRKSGKATGALSRPKGGSDSGSKSINRNSNKGEPYLVV